MTTFIALGEQVNFEEKKFKLTSGKSLVIEYVQFLNSNFELFLIEIEQSKSVRYSMTVIVPLAN